MIPPNPVRPGVSFALSARGPTENIENKNNVNNVNSENELLLDILKKLDILTQKVNKQDSRINSIFERLNINVAK